MSISLVTISKPKQPRAAATNNNIKNIERALYANTKDAFAKLTPSKINDRRRDWANELNAKGIPVQARQLNPFLPPLNGNAPPVIGDKEYRARIVETYEKFGVKYNKSTFPFQDTPSNVQDVLDNYVADKTNKYNQRKFVETFFKSRSSQDSLCAPRRSVSPSRRSWPTECSTRSVNCSMLDSLRLLKNFIEYYCRYIRKRHKSH